MSIPQAFLHDIADNVYDDAPRLVCADWLDENGDSERAGFIRVQCELEPMRDKYEIDRAAELHRREDKLLRLHQKRWLGEMPQDWDHWRTGASAEFRRGFLDTLAMPVRTFLELGPAILALHPTIRRLVLFRVNGYGEWLAACPELAGVAELELACWYSDADAEAIATSPHLRRLQALELWLGRQGSLTDDRLCQTIGRSPVCSKLRELVLLNPNDENEESRQQLVTVCNKGAGRNVAAYRRGWPELFPFAADFWYTFPGYLLDGRMAMANENHQTTPPTLCVLTFDREGNQTNEVLNVPLPDDILAIPEAEWYQHKERMKQHLAESIGFRPGFIRIRDCCFPGDEYQYDRPFWEIYSMQGEEQQFGVPDPDDAESWAEYPCGYAGQFAWRLRNHAYVFGWDRYADKRGEVHST